MEFDRDLHDGNQTIRLFGSVGNARIDNPTVTIQVTNEITKNTFSEQVYVDRTGGFELVIGSRPDGQYVATATHESAGTISTTFTIGQPPPEAVLEEAPQEPVLETEDAPPETEDAVPTVEETVQHAPMASEELLLLPVVLISLSVIISLWLLYRFLRSETQAEHEEGMSSGQDGFREPQPETKAEPSSAQISGTGAFPQQGAVRESVKLQEQPPDHGAVVRSSQKAAGGGFPQKKPQSGHRTDSSSLSKPVETAPTQKREPAVKAAASAVPKAQDRASVRQAGKTGFAAKLEGKLVALDTNICINYMCVRFLDDDGMSDKARDFFMKSKSGKMYPDIPDCIDVALNDGAVRLPWKTTKEFNGKINWFIDKGKMEIDDKPKLEKARLFEIIFESHRSNAHGDIVMGFDDDNLGSVEMMFDGFAKNPHPRMKEKMAGVYTKHLEAANGDEAKIAEVEKNRAEKKFPLSEGDKEILAAVLTNSTEASPICLITMDSDFTKFVVDIQEKIDIEIVSGFQPGRRRADKRSSR